MRGKKCKRKNLLGRSERKRKVALVSGKSAMCGGNVVHPAEFKYTISASQGRSLSTC